MIPDYQTLMLPVLKAVGAGECVTRKIIDKLGQDFKLTSEEREQLLPSRKQRTFDNRVHWAISYLKQAGLIEHSGRGLVVISQEGKNVLATDVQAIDKRFLWKYSSFRDFQTRRNAVPNKKIEATPAATDSAATPDEDIRQMFRQINDALADELLEHVCKASPQFFENLLIDLLLAMGYGGTWEDAGRAIGKTNDGGLDGVIDQDPLGIDQIYIQAKRYQKSSSIGPDPVRGFIGALDGRGANKGLFVTTSSFTRAARDAAEKASKRVILVDGEQLAKLMIRHNVGCRDEEVLYLKKIDEDFFA